MKVKKLFLVGAFLSLSIWSFAQAQFQWKEAQSGGYTYKYVTNDPTQARFYQLKNGLTVILSPTSKKPRIQAFVAVRAGSKTDPSTNTGLAHYLEHMMFKGTDKYGTLDWEKEEIELQKIDRLYEQYNQTTDENLRRAIYREIDSVSGVASRYAIANEYDKMLSAMGAQGTNAFTSFEQTVYTDDIPAAALEKYLTVQAERFRKPVLRLFHTELEAVYEEKNISMDNDRSLVFETLFANLFPNHNYGKQTVIGTVEHLKNPSLVEIRKYYNTYYVPNNMAIILSGDFNPDETIASIDKHFTYMQPKEVPPYTFQPEKPIASPIIKEVSSPEPENLLMAFRLPGASHSDALISDLIGSILTNGQAGLIDLNVVQQQKMLYAYAGTYSLIDYGILFLGGSPIQGQSLDEVRKLLLEQIENLKKGNFSEDLILSIANNYKKDLIEVTESYSNRARSLMSAFTSQVDWQKMVASTEALSKITKQDVMNFANKYLQDNYVAVYKVKGERKKEQTVEKPQITPIETNSDKQSVFLQQVNSMPMKNPSPVFLNFDKDMQKGFLGKAPVLYVQNKDNSLYRLKYRYKIGTLNDFDLSSAASVVSYLGTDKMTASQVREEFYKIASSFSINVGEEYTTVTIEGLQENFEKAVSLYENLIKNLQPNEDVLAALKARVQKARADAKLNKGAIMQALSAYAQYGSDNKYKYSQQEIKAESSQELIDKLQNLNNFEQTIIYFGPLSLEQFTASLKPLHHVPQQFAKPSPTKTFKRVKQTESKVFFANYKMVQAEVRWQHISKPFHAEVVPTVRLFNSYFGEGMGALVFQTIRESKALAYSTAASYVLPNRKDEPAVFVGYVGTQADKFSEATETMNDLINNLPLNETNFEQAKEGVIKNIETDRIIEDNIISYYLNLQQLGIDYDLRKVVYEAVPNITWNDIEKFHQKNIVNKPFSYLVVADEEVLSEDKLKELSPVIEKVSLEELFGY